MKMRTLQGDDEINSILCAAMIATINRLNEEGIITSEQMTEFLDNHVAILIANDGPFIEWLNRKFGKDSESLVSVVRL